MGGMPETPGPSAQELMMLQTLRRTAIFSGLPESSLARCAGCCHLRKLDKGEVLFHEGAATDGFFVVHSGAINVHKISAGGKEQVICVFYPGESFGEIALAENLGYPASAVAIEPSQVILIRRDAFRHEVQRDPDLAMRIIASISQHLRFLVETIEDLKLKQAESRLAQWLLREAGPDDGHPATVALPLAKRLLASQLGISPETFSRVLAAWREAGVVEVNGRDIHLLRTDELRRHLIA
jgi:CRP/FNR family transcriptional regulator